MKKSFQQRIFVGLTALVLLISIMFGSGTVLIAYVTEDLLITQLLQLEADEISKIWQETGTLPTPSSHYMTLYPERQAMPRWLQEAWQHSGPDNEVFAEEQHYHIQSITLSEVNKPVLVAEVSKLLMVTRMTPGIAIILLVIALVSVAFAILLAWRLAKVINAPLKTLANEVESNQISEASAMHLPAEIGLLRERISAAFNALQQALEREQDFTRDVSHELRTPLTHLKNELLLLSQQEEKGHLSASINSMQQDVEDIEQTLAILLAIAREENLNTCKINLRSAVESALLKLHQQSDLETLDLNLELPDNVSIESSPVILALILQNILLNAIFYGDGTLHITKEDNLLTFSNSTGAESKQSKGMGHGLKLISKLAKITGAELRWQDKNQFFQVTIAFSVMPDTN